MKTCTKCNTEKELSMFHKGNNPDGHRTWCATCVSAYKKQNRIDNAKHLKETQRAYDAIQNPLRRSYFHQRYINKKEHILAVNSAYRKENLNRHAAKETKRRAAKINRTPAWLTEDDNWMIEQAYELASLRTKMFGFNWEVDHVLPLQGKIISGLHIPINLQVIPAILNRQKNNRYEVVF
jgi:hypothetical protein